MMELTARLTILASIEFNDGQLNKVAARLNRLFYVKRVALGIQVWSSTNRKRIDGEFKAQRSNFGPPQPQDAAHVVRRLMGEDYSDADIVLHAVVKSKAGGYMAYATIDGDAVICLMEV